MQFYISHSDQSSSARRGTIKTDHSKIETPVFMPIGTQGAVKTIDSEVLTHLDAQIILGNYKRGIWIRENKCGGKNFHLRTGDRF